MKRGGGFNPPLSKRDAVRFVRQLSRYSHMYGMSIGLKNALAVLPYLQNYVEFGVNEECAGEEVRHDPGPPSEVDRQISRDSVGT